MKFHAAPAPGDGHSWVVMSDKELLAGFYGDDAQSDAEAFAALKDALTDGRLPHVLLMPHGGCCVYLNWRPPEPPQPVPSL